MKLQVIDINGNKKSSLDLSDDIFSVKANKEVIKSIINWQISSISLKLKSGAIFTNNGGQLGKFLNSLRSSLRSIGSCNFLSPSVFGELTFIAA